MLLEQAKINLGRAQKIILPNCLFVVKLFCYYIVSQRVFYVVFVGFSLDYQIRTQFDTLKKNPLRQTPTQHHSELASRFICPRNSISLDAKCWVLELLLGS